MLFMGKLTKSMAIFNSYFDITRGLSLGFPHDLPFFNTYGGHKVSWPLGKIRIDLQIPAKKHGESRHTIGGRTW